MIMTADLESLVDLTCLVLTQICACKKSSTTVLYLCFTWQERLDMLEVFTCSRLEISATVELLSLSTSVTTGSRDNIPRSRNFGLVLFSGVDKGKKN